MQQNTQQKPKTAWIEDKTFTHPETGLTVVVSKLPLRRPVYSLKVGTVQKTAGADGRFMPFVSVKSEGHGQGRISIRASSNILSNLMFDAEVYIEEQLQLVEDKEIEDKMYKEHLSLNKGKPSTPVTGKTERDRAKKKNKHASK